MKTFLFLFLITAVIGNSQCSKENNKDEYKSTGVITGYDMAMCACCGGWKISIDNQQYEFDSVPSVSGIIMNKETLPISVKLNWQLINGGCQNRIQILKIKKL
jgi:hypothetical protein